MILRAPGQFCTSHYLQEKKGTIQRNITQDLGIRRSATATLIIMSQQTSSALKLLGKITLTLAKLKDQDERLKTVFLQPTAPASFLEHLTNLLEVSRFGVDPRSSDITMKFPQKASSRSCWHSCFCIHIVQVTCPNFDISKMTRVLPL